ncbi:MFS transporter [Streptomyces sp. NPDC048441]|uniref:MFS transporter n=1 Tax=Streptomyces sp. NPDC048441 TaxID=3365552 RepID=UPI00371A4A0E
MSRAQRAVGRVPVQWRVGGAGMAAVGVTFGFARYGYGLFLPEFRRAFDLPVALVGLIASASYLGYVAALLLVGVLVTRLGPRPLVVIGGLFAAGGMGLVACARGPATLTAGLVLAGTSPGWVWAPYSDAVDRMLAPQLRERAMGAIATGTAFAVTVAGPLALATQGPQWRKAWLAFAAAALLATLGNALVLPGGGRAHPAGNSGAGREAHPATDEHPPRTLHRAPRPGISWLARPAALPLYATAFSYGLVGAVYWAFAVEAVSDHAGAYADVAAPLFWTLMGLAGTAGVLTGHTIGRYGLRRVHRWIFAGLAGAAGLLAVAGLPGAALPGALLSALVYGPCFMAGSGLLAVWSYRVFPDRPTPGFTATVLFLGLGTITGPALLGLLAEHQGLPAVFAATAIASALTQLLPPPKTRSHPRTQHPQAQAQLSNHAP